MNGRLYDPYLQRFLSPDPFVQSPMNPQNYNRYSYVLNNPLMFTDPSGCFHGSPEERQASRAAILQWQNAWMNVVEPPGGSGNSNQPFGYIGSFRESQETVKNWQSIDNQFNNNSQPGLIDWLSGVMIPGVYDLIVTDGHFIFKHESGKHIIDITNYFVQAGKSGNNSRDILQGNGGGNKYGRPESDALWLLSASGGLIKVHNEELRGLELAYRKSKIAPRTVNITTGDVTWVNPKYAKNIKLAGLLGAAGDVANITGIIYNVAYGDGWTLGIIFDGIFGVIGFVPVAGDFTVLVYESMKWQVNNPEQAFRHQLLLKH